MLYSSADELSKDFHNAHGNDVATQTRPYPFIKFGMREIVLLLLLDSTIQKIKRLYSDTRTQRNLDKLNAELADVQKIMTANIQDVLGRGEKLDSECDV